MRAPRAPSCTVAHASRDISSNSALIDIGSSSVKMEKRLRTTSNATGASRKPTAEPTPASRGMMTWEMPSLRATAIACSGAPPPKAISVRWLTSDPFSTACTRAALAIFSSTISMIAWAALSISVPSGSPTAQCTTLRAAGKSRDKRPPAKSSASRRPSSRLASVTAAL